MMKPFVNFLPLILLLCVSEKRPGVNFQLLSKWETVSKRDTEGPAGQLWSVVRWGLGRGFALPST